MDIIDANGKEVFSQAWLVKKQAYDDLSYRYNPEQVYEVIYAFDEDFIARKPYDEDAPTMEVKTLVYRDNYVVVREEDFDAQKMWDARRERAKAREERALKEHEKKRAAFLSSLDKKPTVSWWRKLFS